MAIRDNLISIPKTYNCNDYEPILEIRGAGNNLFTIDVSDINALYYVQTSQGTAHTFIYLYSSYDWDDVEGRVLDNTIEITEALKQYTWDSIRAIEVSNIQVVAFQEGRNFGTTMIATDGGYPKKIQVVQNSGYAEMCYKLPYNDNNILKFTSISQTATPVLDQRNTMLVSEKDKYGVVVGNKIGTLDAVGSTIITPTDYKLGKWIWIGGKSYGTNGAYNAIMEVL